MEKFCRLEDYRRPVHFELELLQEHPGCFLVIAARNGFEDDPADVEWGFSFLLPEMAEASCQGVAFLMAEVSAIEEEKEEMDFWMRECSRYFPVKKASSYVEAVRQLKA